MSGSLYFSSNSNIRTTHCPSSVGPLPVPSPAPVATPSSAPVDQSVRLRTSLDGQNGNGGAGNKRRRTRVEGSLVSPPLTQQLPLHSHKQIPARNPAYPDDKYDASDSSDSAAMDSQEDISERAEERYQSVRNSSRKAFAVEELSPLQLLLKAQKKMKKRLEQRGESTQELKDLVTRLHSSHTLSMSTVPELGREEKLPTGPTSELEYKSTRCGLDKIAREVAKHHPNLGLLENDGVGDCPISYILF